MKELESVVVRFSGDSGDGMQLTGTQFSDTTAQMGNDLATFPDYPSEIRAPQGTIAGVSGFQVQFGSTEISTPGDDPDVLVAMNPAALKANLKALKKNGIIIVNTSAFDEKGLEKAGYAEDPLRTGELNGYQIIEAPLKDLVMECLESVELDNKLKMRCKNFYALGITYYLFNRTLETTKKWIEEKFKNNPTMAYANTLTLESGFHFAEKSHLAVSTFKVPMAKIEPGRYRQINGNVGTAWGLMQGAESAGLKLFLGSYPITPATDILHELSKFKEFGVKTFQAEDEIAGICSAIGAAFGGAMACTTTSGPGLALKGEAIGLAMIYEIPLVIVNVQRGGPSTGLPTKTEQSDLLQAMYGRNGECPVVVLAAARPNDCYFMAYEACRIAIEHMTPVILLTDGYIANGAEPWKIPDPSEFAKIKATFVDGKKDPAAPFKSYERDEKLARPWAIPGMPGYEHRIGGLEKEDVTGGVCHDAKNHQVMTDLRQKKVDMIENHIPLQELEGDASGDLLVLSWGGTYGAAHTAVKKARAAGKNVTLAHVRYINPFPKNLGEILSKFKQVLIPELNNGQMRSLIRSKYGVDVVGLNKVQGQPFKVSELSDEITRLLNEL